MRIKGGGEKPNCLGLYYVRHKPTSSHRTFTSILCVQKPMLGEGKLVALGLVPMAVKWFQISVLGLPDHRRLVQNNPDLPENGLLYPLPPKS